MAKIHEREESLPAEPLLTVQDVMRWLHMSRSTVYQLIRRGELRAVHIGSAVRFQPRDVQAYLDRRAARERGGRGSL